MHENQFGQCNQTLFKTPIAQQPGFLSSCFNFLADILTGFFLKALTFILRMLGGGGVGVGCGKCLIQYNLENP